MNYLNFLEVVLAFCFMVAIHEWGHYLAMRLVGVGVEEYCLFFPPRIYSKKFGSTLFSIGSIPLGGFCKPQGGDLSGGQSAEEMYAAPPKPGDYLAASWWKRIIILLAGPLMNFISGVLIIYLVLVAGEKVGIEKPVLGFVPPESLAYTAGFQENDQLLKVDGAPIQNMDTDLDDAYAKIAKTPGASAVFTVERDGKTMEIALAGDPQKPRFGFGLFPKDPAIIGDVPLGTPAWKAGIRPGDTILSVNGKKVSEWMQLTYAIKTQTSDVVQLQVERNGKTYPVTVHRIYNGVDNVIGIAPKDPDQFEIKRMGFLEAAPESFSRAIGFCAMYVDVIGKLVTGKMALKDNLGGAVSILRTMYQKASQGMEQFAKTVASISLILFLMNLLPLGIVDGGQILLCLVEGIKQNPVSVKFQHAYQVAGFALVVSLMGFAIFMDVWGWIMENFHRQIP
jgi:regulator of sigma E protease